MTVLALQRRLTALGFPEEITREAAEFFAALQGHFEGHPDCGYRPIDPQLIRDARRLHDDVCALTGTRA